MSGHDVMPAHVDVLMSTISPTLDLLIPALTREVFDLLPDGAESVTIDLSSMSWRVDDADDPDGMPLDADTCQRVFDWIGRRGPELALVALHERSGPVTFGVDDRDWMGSGTIYVGVIRPDGDWEPSLVQLSHPYFAPEPGDDWAWTMQDWAREGGPVTCGACYASCGGTYFIELTPSGPACGKCGTAVPLPVAAIVDLRTEVPAA